MRTVLPMWILPVLGLCCVLMVAAPAGGAENYPTITNLFAIRQFDSVDRSSARIVQLNLEGQVCWVGSPGRQFALIDSSDGAMVEVVDYDVPPLRAGQVLRLSGSTTMARRNGSIVLNNQELVVDNDGTHAMTEKSGSAFLKSGRRPIRVEWFNRWGGSGLTLEWEGPQLPRRKVTDGDLFRRSGKSTNWVNGVDYREYPCWGAKLPWFSQMQPSRNGTCSNFDLTVRSLDDGVALRFSSFLEVPRDGIYKFFLNSDDGSRLFVGGSDLNLKMEIVGESELPVPRKVFVGQMLNDDENGFWAEVEGKVTQAEAGRDGLRLELSVGVARMEVKTSDTTLSPTNLLNSVIRATGFCQCGRGPDGLNVPRLLLVSELGRIGFVKALSAVAAANVPAVTNGSEPRLLRLTSAAEIKRLKPEDARRGIPAKVRGVVTSINPYSQAFTIQDSTRGLYVSEAEPVEVGEYVELEGVTDAGDFAPILKASRVEHLGQGRMPEPMRPSWDQLMNGSLTSEYVEFEGIVASTDAAGVELLVPGGVLKVDFAGDPEQQRNLQENALVRIRGPLAAAWNPQTHQVEPGRIRMRNFTVRIEKPPPKNLFDAPSKTPSELLLFDPQASGFQRVKVSGQVVHLGEEVGFVMVGSNGLRFAASTASGLKVGDLVDVVGYPDLAAFAPLLRNAVARTASHAALPEQRLLSPDKLLAAEHDSTRVRIIGVLVEARQTSHGLVMDMLAGARGFVARLNSQEKTPRLLAGSRLELTGVYSAMGGNNISHQGVTSFELLLDNPADIRILARPPWWTLKRLLILTGALALVLTGAGLWITQLHRQVELRSKELEVQIREREHAEQHRAMEQERARIARDLHDELGSGLTEIRMLANMTKNDRPQNQLQIAARSQQMVRALDEIVWAMNPKHDSLKSLGSYFCLYADRFLKLANINCRLNGSLELPDEPLDPLHRHEFFLAFKEALTNIVRHSGATEVRLGIHRVGKRLRLSLVDNGAGLKVATKTDEMDGLVNMRSRIEKIGGRFNLTSLPDRGTIVRFYLPLK